MSRYRFLPALWLLGLILWPNPELHSEVNRVPAPKNQAEAEKLMRVTYDQHVLPAGANPATLEEMLKLGEVILFYDHPKEIPWMSAAGILIAAPVEKVYEAVMDHPNYAKYIPMTEGIDDHYLFGNFYQEDLHLKIKLAFVNYRMDYGLYDLRRPPYRMDWSLAWGEFDRNVGFWELIPTPDGKSTMAFYSIYSEPRSKFFKMMYAAEPTLEMLTNVSTATMIAHAVKAEAERRVGVKPAPAKPTTGTELEKILAADPNTLGRFLERGKLLILEPGPTVYLIAGALVNANPARAYQVITDFSGYPKFVPGVKKVSKVGSGKGGDTYQFDTEFNLAGVKFDQSDQWTYQFASPEQVSWQIARPCCGAAPGFWKLIPLGDKTIVFNGTTADIRALGRIPRYALSVEPTLEYATLASQGLLVINSIKSRIEKK